MSGDKIQLLFFFANGYLLSRLLIRWKITDLVARKIVEKSNGSPSHTMFYLILSSVVLSFFIPNVITVLTLLPVINRLLKSNYKDIFNHSYRKSATLYTLAIIYGSNIGGIGAITSTPANGVLAGFTEFHNVPYKELIQFTPWLAWGIPLVILSTFAAWIVLYVYYLIFVRNDLNISVKNDHLDNLKSLSIGEFFYLRSIFFAFYYLGGSFFLSLFYYSTQSIWFIYITAAYSILFYYFAFVQKITIKGRKVRYLKFMDLFREIPIKGLLLMGVAVIIGIIIVYSGLDKEIFDLLKKISRIPYSFPFLWLLALGTSFSTEILSNTVVQLSLMVSITASPPMGGVLLTSLLVITFSSTSAFMTPIATGVNGLAYGGVRGVSLSKMLILGIFMNLLGSFIISGWLYYLIPWMLSL